MTSERDALVERLHRVLVEEIRARRPEYLREPFTVAEIYQELVPYRSHRDRIGASMNGDYEHALLRLLSGEGSYLLLESEPARRRMQEELASSNPNTGVFRDYAALDVRLNPVRVPGEAARTAGKPPEVRPAQAPPKEAPPVQGAVEARNGAEGAGTADKAVAIAPGAREKRPSVAPRPPARSEEAPAECRWCREALPRKERLRFCPFCGTDVNLVPCPKCGEEVEPGWRFCIACGSQAPDGAEA